MKEIKARNEQCIEDIDSGWCTSHEVDQYELM
jgi:hypothetical protein